MFPLGSPPETLTTKGKLNNDNNNLKINYSNSSNCDSNKNFKKVNDKNTNSKNNDNNSNIKDDWNYNLVIQGFQN